MAEGITWKPHRQTHGVIPSTEKPAGFPTGKELDARGQRTARERIERIDMHGRSRGKRDGERATWRHHKRALESDAFAPHPGLNLACRHDEIERAARVDQRVREVKSTAREVNAGACDGGRIGARQHAFNASCGLA